MKNSFRLFVIASLLIFTSCAETPEKKKARESTLIQGHSEAEILKIIEKENEPIKVEENEFFGVQIGNPISEFSGVATKGKISVEGEAIEVYNIEQRGEEIGYFLPDEENEDLVGNLYIQSPKAVTKDEFKIGTTSTEILNKYPEAKIFEYGKEKRSAIVIDNIQYRLNVKLDASDDEQESKVIEIVIMK